MAHKYFKIMALSLSLAIAGTLIVSSAGDSANLSIESFTNIIIHSMNDSSPNNNTYQSGFILRMEKLSSDDEPSVVKVGILLEVVCPEMDNCPREYCTMLVRQNESTKIVVDDQSKECQYSDIFTNLRKVNDRTKREATQIDVHDPIVKKFMSSVSSTYYEDYRKVGKPFFTRMVNATIEDIPDGSKYVIHFHIVEPTCLEDGPNKSCFVDDFSQTRLCTINVDYKDKLENLRTKVSSTCENPQNPVNP